MSTGAPDPNVDALLDAFIAAWHAGDASNPADLLAQAAPDDRDELAALIAGFLELAPTVSPNAAAAERLAGDPLVARLAAMEGEWWGAREGATDAVGSEVAATEFAEAASAAPVNASDEAASAATASASGEASVPWGQRLRAAREAAGLSVVELGHAFAARFGLASDDVGRAPTVLAELEAGALPAEGVAARAARALEELVGAARGALVDGAAPALGAPVLRGELPESGADRQRLAELLRAVDDAVAGDAPGHADTLTDLLGA